MGCNCSKETLYVDNQKFFVISKIATGGFGTIDLVEEAKTHNNYALKRVYCDNRSDLEKCSLENKYYKQLANHINIVKLIHDDIVEDTKKGGYLLMSIFPYYENGNLQEELDRNNKSQSLLKLTRLIKLFYAISSGLNYIHESNLAHRDLKPQNVLLSSDERVVALLTDFGSMTERVIEISTSKKAQEIQDFSAQNCSMFYKAPELFNVRIGTIDEKADIWSLGCVLYALMFNKGPFDYVAGKGDSIALAVESVKYTIPTHETLKRPDYFVNLLKSTINYESSKRENLNKIIKDVSKMIDMDINNDQNQIV